jgi:hypothetical protein
MLSVAGETAMDVRVGAAASMVSVAIPLMPFSAAVTVVEPAATAEASPDELIVAIAVFAAVQLAVVVTFAVEPSLYVAVAVNCSVAPTAMLAVLGDAVTAVRVFAGRGVIEPTHPAIASMSKREIERHNG